MKKPHLRTSVLLTVLILVPCSAYSGENLAGEQDKNWKESSYREGELLVKFLPTVSADSRKKAHENHGAQMLKEFRLKDGYLAHVKLKEGRSAKDGMKQYAQDPEVEYAEPNLLIGSYMSPDDAHFTSLWGLHNTGQTGGKPDADIDAPEAWEIARGDGDVVVAVLDTGIDRGHTDLGQNIWTNEAEANGRPGVDDDGNGYVDDVYGIDVLSGGEPMDLNGHGTHVAGIIGAIGNNGRGTAGLNWNVKMVACRFLDAGGSGLVSGAIACLEYVRTLRDRGVNIIATNNSWGASGFSGALYDAIGAQRDILFITGAGNKNLDNEVVSHYPAKYYLPTIISAVATDHLDNKAWFSNFGKQSVHVGAPGEGIVSTLPNNQYGLSSGTSSAAPFVTGLAALLQSQDLLRDWRTIKNLILAGGDATDDMSNKTISGRRINAHGSLTCNKKPLFSVLKYATDVNVPATLAAVSIDCGAPVAPVTLRTYFSNEAIELRDDGTGPDLAAGDGVFSASWTPTRENEVLFFDSAAGSEIIAPPLEIVSSVLSAGTVGAQYSEMLVAKGGVPPYSWKITTGSLPTGLTLDGSTGELSGVPSTAGSSLFAVEAKDSNGASVKKAVSLTIIQPLFISTQSLSGGTVNMPYSDTLTATGGKTPYTWVLSAGKLPNGLSLGRTSGTLSGTAVETGSFDVTIQVMDSASRMDVKTFRLAVIGIAAQTVPFGTVGTTYSHQFIVQGGTLPYAWEVVTGHLPVGLVLDPVDGHIHGTPTSAGSWDLTVQVLDGDGMSAAQTITIPCYQPLNVITPTLPAGKIGMPYAQTLLGSGGRPPYAWSLASGALPPGLAIDEAGRIAGTPTNAGSYRAGIKVVDDNNSTAFATVSITIAAPLVIDTPNLSSGLISRPYSDVLAATGGSPPYTWSVLSGALPDGLTMNSATGAITGIPVLAGAFTCTIQVADAASESAAAAVSLSIADKAAAPELSIRYFTAPFTTGAGKTVTLSATTKNYGPGDAGASITRVYFSADSQYDSGDIVLGDIPVAALGVNQSAGGSVAITIPVGTPTGSYYLIARADADSAVAELNEDNNTYSRQVAVGTDLGVSSFSAPFTAGAGKTVTLSATTKNYGPGDAADTVTRIYLSADNAYDSGDIALGDMAVPALVSGQSASSSVTVTIPSGTLTGSYYLIACADADGAVAELNEENNTYSRQATVGTDLAVSSFSAPFTAGAGKSFAVLTATRNYGPGDAAASTTRIYFSLDNVYDSGDIALGDMAVPALVSGQSASSSVTITIPAGTSTGSYYLIARADADSAVAELNEENNTYSRQATVGTDLAVSSFSAPFTAGAGKSFAVLTATRNYGPGDAAASTTRIYFSLDNVYDSGDIALGDMAVPALASGQSANSSVTVTIPAGTSTGSYYLIARADADSAVAELNEENNTYSRQVTVGTDLAVSSFSAPFTAGAGKTVTLSATTKNYGPGDAGASITRIYFSADSQYDVVDIALSDMAVPALVSGQSASSSVTITIPAGTPTGSYYLIARADADSAVAELNEENNTYNRLTNVGLDLSVSSFSAPLSAGAGKNVTLSATTKNYGPGDAADTVTRIYLSTDSRYDAGDIALGHMVVPALVSGQSASSSITAFIPDGTSTGSYYVIARADADSAVAELNEENNTYNRLIKIE